MNEEKWGILYCPKSGYWSSPKKRWEKIERCLQAEGIDYDYVQSENSGSVDRLVKMLISNGYKTIVIVGGDSALNDAVNCLMQIDQQKREEIVLGVVPNGMMNDFAHFWEFDEDNVEQTIGWLKQRRIRKIDLGCIRYVSKQGDHCRRYFLNCINIGLVATIMNLRRQTRHYFGSRTLSFLFSFILMIFQRLEYKMHLKINTDEVKRKVMTVCIGNALGYGQTPNAVPYNGQIYLFVRGKFLNHRSVHPYRTQKVEVLQADHAMVGIDGRMMNTPVGAFTVSVEQEVINFLIPC